MSDFEDLSFTVYVCSVCHHINTLQSRLKFHQQNVPRCAESTILTFDASVKVPTLPKVETEPTEPTEPIPDEPKETIPQKNERKMYEFMSTKVPSGFCDEEDDYGLRRRIEYLCADEQRELRKKLFARVRCGPARVGERTISYPATDISIRLMTHLWGIMAPPEFRSVMFINRMIHDLQAVETPGDPAGVLIRKYGDPQERTELVIGVYIALLEVADCVIDQCEECAAEAYRDLLRGTRRMTTLDVLEKNKTYEENRKKDPFRVKIANSFRRDVLETLRVTMKTLKQA